MLWPCQQQLSVLTDLLASLQHLHSSVALAASHSAAQQQQCSSTTRRCFGSSSALPTPEHSRQHEQQQQAMLRPPLRHTRGSKHRQQQQYSSSGKCLYHAGSHHPTPNLAAPQQGAAASQTSSSSRPLLVQQQAPSAPGTPVRPPPAPHQQQHLGRQLAARHLRQYLQSINSSGFVEGLADGIRAGDRLAISRSLTLCESSRPDHALQAAALLRKLIDDNDARQQQQQQQQQRTHASLLPPAEQQQQQQQQQQQGQRQKHEPVPQPPATSGLAATTAAASAAALTAASQHQQPQPVPHNSINSSSSVALRIGLSGPPGAGKSSLIESWGCYLADQGSRVAVLAVDPSSMESGGAILGDKTRMARLSSHAHAYVRPSPARGTLGGVSRATYDAMLICEAAGYDRILVETVGVGQSEVAVADLVDCMMLVMPPVGGDDLQMIKRGIMEVADIVAVNKGDGETEKAAERAAAEYSGCLHLMPHRYRAWEPQALAVSAHTGKGVPALARLVSQFQQALNDSGELHRCRVQRAESVAWLSLEEQLLEGLRQDPHVRWLLGRLLPMVRAGTMAPRSAADIALAYFYQHCG